jgi:hypothetical protein
MVTSSNYVTIMFLDGFCNWFYWFYWFVALHVQFRSWYSIGCALRVIGLMFLLVILNTILTISIWKFKKMRRYHNLHPAFGVEWMLIEISVTQCLNLYISHLIFRSCDAGWDKPSWQQARNYPWRLLYPGIRTFYFCYQKARNIGCIPRRYCALSFL